MLHATEVVKAGVGTYIGHLANAQVASGRASSVMAVIPRSQAHELRTSGVNIETFADSGNRMVNALRLARAVRSIVRDYRPDVVHLHSTFAGLSLRPILKLTGGRVPVVYCPHGWAFSRDVSFVSRSIASWLERLLAGMCDRIVCVSEDERRQALRFGIDGSRMSVVLNGSPDVAPQPVPVQKGWPPEAIRVLFVGRFDRQKGIDILFGALEQLGGRFAACIAGDSLRVSIGRIPQNASYVGWLTPGELEGYYRAADMVVMPSRWEGLPLVAREARRAGAPVASSRVGGIPEVVASEKTGILFETPTVTDLIRALESFDVVRFRLFGEQGRQRFKNEFTFSRVHTQIWAIYESLTKNSPAR